MTQSQREDIVECLELAVAALETAATRARLGFHNGAGFWIERAQEHVDAALSLNAQALLESAAGAVITAPPVDNSAPLGG